MMYVENNILIDFAFGLGAALTALGDMFGKLMIILKFLLKFAMGI